MKITIKNALDTSTVVMQVTDPGAETERALMIALLFQVMAFISTSEIVRAVSVCSALVWALVTMVRFWREWHVKKEG